MLTVMSTLTISPSCNGLRSGIPWTATLLTDVQTLFGNPLQCKGDGYAPASMVKL